MFNKNGFIEMKKVMLSLFTCFIFISSITVKPMENRIVKYLKLIQGTSEFGERFGYDSFAYDWTDKKENSQNSFVHLLKKDLKILRAPIQVLLNTAAMFCLFYKYRNNVSVKTKILSLIFILISAPVQFYIIHPILTDLLHKIIQKNNPNEFSYLLFTILILFGAELNVEGSGIQTQPFNCSATELALKHNNMKILKLLLKYFGWALSERSVYESFEYKELFNRDDLYFLKYALKNNLLPTDLIKYGITQEIKSKIVTSVLNRQTINFEKIKLLINYIDINLIGSPDLQTLLLVSYLKDPYYFKKLFVSLNSESIHQCLGWCPSFDKEIFEKAADKINVFKLFRFYNQNRKKFFEILKNYPGINIDIKNENGDTLLIHLLRFYNCNNFHIRDIEQLLGLGADITISDNSMWGPMNFYEHAQDRPEILEVIKEYKANVAKEVYESTKKVDPNLDTSIGNGLYPHVANIVAEYV